MIEDVEESKNHTEPHVIRQLNESLVPFKKLNMLLLKIFHFLIDPRTHFCLSSNVQGEIHRFRLAHWADAAAHYFSNMCYKIALQG